MSGNKMYLECVNHLRYPCRQTNKILIVKLKLGVGIFVFLFWFSRHSFDDFEASTFCVKDLVTLRMR